jgi:hypothetical protein
LDGNIIVHQIKLCSTRCITAEDDTTSDGSHFCAGELVYWVSNNLNAITIVSYRCIRVFVTWFTLDTHMALCQYLACGTPSEMTAGHPSTPRRFITFNLASFHFEHYVASVFRLRLRQYADLWQNSTQSSMHALLLRVDTLEDRQMMQLRMCMSSFDDIVVMKNEKDIYIMKNLKIEHDG